MSTPPPSVRKVTLTKSELATEDGCKLIALVNEIISDGFISDDEIISIHQALYAISQDIAGVRHLIATIEDIALDGVVTDDERDILWRQFERILPPEERMKLAEIRKNKVATDKEESRMEREAVAKKKAVERDLAAAQRESDRTERERERANRKPAWHGDPITDAQIQYIKGLGGNPRSVSTKGEASALIDSLVCSPASFTPRQRMVLRFWDITPQPSWAKRDVSEWMDTWYAEDPDRLTAWEAYKEFAGDTGTQTDPNRVPVGAGHEWLARVKGGSAVMPPIRALQASTLSPRPAVGSVSAQSGMSAGTITFGVLLLLLSGALLMSCVSKK